jgi:CubicO group peptidase (beta-lactamase class C family)
MARYSKYAVWFTTALLASNTPVLAQAAALASDTPATTAAGVPFTAPKAWTLVNGDGLAKITAPEGDLVAAIVDVGPARDAAAAMAKALARFDPTEKHPLKLSSPLAKVRGWDERVGFLYETSLNEKLTFRASAQRKGADWTVLIVRGADATSEKRLGALGLIGETLVAKGYSRENFAGKTAHPLDPARVALLREFVRQSMAEIGVPGVGLALMDHGKVVFEGGEGVKELGKPDPVDAHTLFAIASNTKGMSTLLLAELADAGKLGWNQKVTDVYPAFRLGSAATTDKVLIKHLVCACTGLPRKDFELLYNTTLKTPASDTFRYLAETEPTSGFGEVFQYNNLMASAAGYIAAHLYYPKLELGVAYDKAMQAHIFTPLGMTDTVLDIDTMLRRNHATPHAYTIDGVTAPARMDLNYTFQPFRPAGGAYSSSHDMIRYVANELTQGVLPNGKRLVSAANLLERRKPNVPIGEHAAYGMGLESDKTWGVEVVHHGGSLEGFKSDWMAIPEAQVGAVLLTNSDEGQLMLAPFMRRLIEVLYDGKPEAVATLTAAAARNKALYADERKRFTVPPDAAVVAKIALRYRSADLGEIVFTRSANRLTGKVGMLVSDFATRGNDDGTISLVSTDPGLVGFEYVVGQKDGKRVLITRDAQHDYVFVEE